MDDELDCDFYFGDTLHNKIKIIDYKTIEGFKKELKNIFLKKYGFKWQKGVWRLILKPYTHYIITGDPSILSSWVLLILAKFTRKKVFAWTHGLKRPVETKGDLFKKMFFRLFHKILLYGDFSKEVMSKEGFITDKLIPIYNSLDYNRQIKIRAGLKESSVFHDHFKNTYPTIIYTGRIQKSKKLNLLVIALKELALDGIICNLTLVGSEVDKTSAIPELVNKYRLNERIWFYGPCYDEEQLGNLFYNADVCVSPGPVGLTALHALTYGCPVISNNDFETQMPEHEVIVPKQTGDFFENDSVASLTNTIKMWINLSIDKRSEVRQNSYRIIAEKWNPNYQIAVLKKIFNK